MYRQSCPNLVGAHTKWKPLQAEVLELIQDFVGKLKQQAAV